MMRLTRFRRVAKAEGKGRMVCQGTQDDRQLPWRWKKEEIVEKERCMKLGVIVPQREIGLDVGALRF
jgi:hypothetical protein